MPRRRPRMIGEPVETGRTRPIRAGRQTRPSYSSYFGLLPYNYIPRRQYETYNISKLENSYMTASQLLALLPDLSADVGLALWNTLRLGSAGFEYRVLGPDGNQDEQGQQLIADLLDRVNERGGGLNGMICQWLMSGFLQGAVAGEVAIMENLREVDDFIVVDPFTIRFNRDENLKLQAWHQPPSGSVNLQGGFSTTSVLMNPETFWYVPIDPWIDDPYGRPPAAPVLQEVWFDVAVMYDLRKVIHNQGWPRIDIKILEEVLLKNAPANVKSDATKLQTWLGARFSEVQTAYDDLNPDDSFIHFDSVEITQAAQTATQVFNAEPLIRCIERRVIKALKQLPILMGSNEGTTESHGSIQWQIYVAGLESLQGPIKFMLSRMMQLALQVWGRVGTVECEFEQIRTTDRLVDANAEAAEIQNAQRKWMLGLMSWEELAEELTGSPPPDGAVEPDASMFVAQPAQPAQDTEATRSAEELRAVTRRLALYPEDVT
jgi:hypothetical protein